MQVQSDRVLLLGAQLRVRVAKSGQIPDLDSNLN